jgi:hypothetical protein
MFHFNVFFHGSYGIGFVVSYEPFSTCNVYGYDFRTNYLLVTNNTMHDLVLGKINMLVIIYLIKNSGDQVVVVWLPCCTLFTQILQLLF